MRDQQHVISGRHLLAEDGATDQSSFGNYLSMTSSQKMSHFLFLRYCDVLFANRDTKNVLSRHKQIFSYFSVGVLCTLFGGGNETSLVLTFCLVSLPRRPPDTSLVTEKWSRYYQKGLFSLHQGSFYQMRHLSQGSFSQLSPWSRYQKESRSLVSFSRSGLVTTTKQGT